MCRFSLVVEHLACNQKVAGSIPAGGFYMAIHTQYAQRDERRLSPFDGRYSSVVERALRKRTVVGSIPTGGFFFCNPESP